MKKTVAVLCLLVFILVGCKDKDQFTERENALMDVEKVAAYNVGFYKSYAESFHGQIEELMDKDDLREKAFAEGRAKMAQEISDFCSKEMSESFQARGFTPKDSVVR